MAALGFVALLCAAPLAQSPYAVLVGVGEDDPYHAAAQRLVEGRSALLIAFDPTSTEWPGLAERLRELKPRNVAIVLRPEQLDYNLQRRIWTLARDLDDDPFVDFAWGYVTGATPASAMALVEAGLSDRRRAPAPGFVVGGQKRSRRFTNPFFLRRRALPSFELQLKGDGQDHRVEPDRVAFEAAKPLLEERSIFIFTGHGYPRQVVGAVWAEDLEGLRLPGAVVLNLGCYTGVTDRWFDLELGRWKERAVPADSSFALRMIDTGLAGYTASLCPRPAGPELYADFVEAACSAATTGEVRRRDADKLALGYLGAGLAKPELSTVKDGDIHNPMKDLHRILLDWGVGGVLFGDPAARPLESADETHPQRVKRERVEDGFRIDVSILPMWVWRLCSDPFAEGGPARKVHLRIPLDGEIPKTVAVEDLKIGKTSLASTPIWSLEEDQGTTYLQLKIAFANGMERGALQASVHIRTLGE